MKERNDSLTEFLNAAGWGAAVHVPLKGDASFRRYTRLTRGNETAMLMDAPPPQEDVRPYLAVAKHLYAQGYGAPGILAEDAQHGFLLLEDLGDDLYTRVLAAGRADESALYTRAVDVLLAWAKNSRMRKHAELALPDYSNELLMREVALFSDWFLPQAVGETGAAALREEYLALWQDILRANTVGGDLLVHRDYHADNLLALPEFVGLLDFQDAVWGHAAYDLASLLEDARRDVSDATVRACLEQYVRESGADRQAFMTAYAVLAAQRNCKIVGIFVRLAKRDGKHSYLRYLPRVWGHLMHDLEHPSMAKLAAWVHKNVPQETRGELNIAA